MFDAVLILALMNAPPAGTTAPTYLANVDHEPGAFVQTVGVDVSSLAGTAWRSAIDAAVEAAAGDAANQAAPRRVSDKHGEVPKAESVLSMHPEWHWLELHQQGLGGLGLPQMSREFRDIR